MRSTEHNGMHTDQVWPTEVEGDLLIHSNQSIKPLNEKDEAR